MARQVKRAKAGVSRKKTKNGGQSSHVVSSFPAPTPSWFVGREPFVYTLLAYLFGVVFVIALLSFAVAIPNPSSYQLFIFQIVLALAAAGVAAVVPGMISVNFGTSLAATGAMAVFAVVMYINPPALVLPAKASALQDRATMALIEGNYGLAKQLLQDARNLAKDDYFPTFLLAKAEYKLGNYESARQLYLEAYQKSGETESKRNKSLLYNVSLALEAQQKYDDALKNFERIREGLPSTDEMYKNIVFSEGQLYLERAMAASPIRTDDLTSATKQFNVFIEQDGTPSQWAYYNLSCIEALVAAQQTGEFDQKKHQNASLSYIRESLAQLKEYDGATKEYHYKMMQQMFNLKSLYVRQPGWPVRCPKLVDLITASDPELLQAAN